MSIVVETIYAVCHIQFGNCGISGKSCCAVWHIQFGNCGISGKSCCAVSHIQFGNCGISVWELRYFWCGIIFFLVLLSMCLCLWKTRYRDSRIFIGTSQPIYSPLSSKQPSLANGERYRDDITEAEYYRTPPPTGVYGYNTTVPPTYDDVINNYKEDHKK
ncbi:Hypothetical predicted protein [Mytilus galloprovincialis]|uniref:Vesicular, overexpressed in cancer, prosurvival protein 1 n=1 Tax=Mytilus galloprovincialis TaxID=29158 RepID=A0A8B6CCI6_MYTGA|nr:Hypothetical predicted protein [Mytilus galloprovincialis]